MKRVRRTKSDPSVAPATTNAAPRFDLEATGAFEGLPFVLRVDSMKSEHMPELGQSGMPPSLEAYVPPDLRFWKASTPEGARDTRDALIDAGIFTPGSVAKIDGVHRLTVQRTFVAHAYEDEDVVLAKRAPSVVHAASTLAINASASVMAIKVAPAELTQLDPALPWIVELDANDDATSPALAMKTYMGNVRAFTLETRPGLVFVTSVPARKNAPHVVEHVVSVMVKRDVRFVTKAEGDVAANEERFVLGVVLEPDIVDSQKDTYDVATIRAAAHGFMQYYRNVGLQHELYVTGRIQILESYLAPVDMDVGGQTVKTGTWLMGLRFVDDGLWQKVKSGELTGLSIGGTAIREPESGELASS